jgi:hypothetical protein
MVRCFTGSYLTERIFACSQLMEQMLHRSPTFGEILQVSPPANILILLTLGYSSHRKAPRLPLIVNIGLSVNPVAKFIDPDRGDKSTPA